VAGTTDRQVRRCVRIQVVNAPVKARASRAAFYATFDTSTPKKAKVAAKLIEEGIENGKGIISYQVVQEFFPVALRRFVQPMSLGDAEQYLSITFRPLLAVHSSESLYGGALRLQSQHEVSWFDALILASALEAECGILYSEDFQHGRCYGSLKVQNPLVGI
jgi:predicted nucleic acid-binding protein